MVPPEIAFVARSNIAKAVNVSNVKNVSPLNPKNNRTKTDERRIVGSIFSKGFPSGKGIF
jgi:hypothetical protein